MGEEYLSEEVVQWLKSVKSKRARAIIEHILKHGSITTEELKKTYGYEHPPRAARDVREAGIPLKSFRTKSSDGRSIVGYKFGNLAEIQRERLGGREALPKALKDDLYNISRGRCAICFGQFASRYLQVDHRIPYEIAGEEQGATRATDDYMLLCGSCNRAKSWSCEHCPNWSEKSSKICSQCYWARPEDYTHIALREVRRMDILWDEAEIQLYEKLKRIAREGSCNVPDYVKKIIARHLEGHDSP